MTSTKYLATIVFIKKEFLVKLVVAVFVHNTLTYSIRHHLRINNGDVKALCIEMFNAKNKNIFIKKIYRQPARVYNLFKIYFKTFFRKLNTVQLT